MKKRTFRGAKKFSELFADVSRPAFSNHGFANHKIGAYWPQLLGEKLSKYTMPQKIVFKPGQTTNGVLHIGVSNPGLSLEIQSNESVIVEKLSTFFGYQAVNRIRVNIDAAAANKNKPQEVEDNREIITAEEKNDFERNVKKIDNEELKKVLRSLTDHTFKIEKD